jgi:hypothetical protein
MVDIYGTVAGYKAYVLARTGVVVATDDALISPALLVASEYIDANYRAMFPGWKVLYRAQVREWPRQGAYDDKYQAIGIAEIPVEVEYATYEAALREIASPGSLRTDVTMGTAISSVSIEGALSVTYAGVSGVDDLQVTIPAIDAVIAPVLTGDAASYSKLSGKSVRG